MANKPSCGIIGDFGHTNLWGTPKLMFDVVCCLPKGHDGPHRAKVPIRLSPTFEPNGVKVDSKSVEIVGEVYVHWKEK